MFNKLRCWLWGMCRLPRSVEEARIEIQRVADHSAGLNARLLQLTAERSEEVARLKKEGQARHAALAKLIVLEWEGQAILALPLHYKDSHCDRSNWMQMVHQACSDALRDTGLRLLIMFIALRNSHGEEVAFSATLRCLSEFLARVET